MSSLVSLQPCGSYEGSDVGSALEALLAPLGGLAGFVRSGQTVILKPNLISDSAPERAATTHPAVLAGLAEAVLALGATPAIADAPAWGGPLQVARATGIQDVCDRLGIAFIHLNQHAEMPGCRPAIARRFHVDPRILAADVVINVAKWKAHQQLGFTGALKNLYGCMAGREKAWHHCAQSRTDMVFARYLAAFAHSLPVALHVTDAIVAMEGMGPRMGSPRPLGLLAASRDGTAVDAILAEVTSSPESHRLMLQACAELELGESDLACIDVVGADPAGVAMTDFLWPQLVGVFFSPVRLARGWVRNRRLLAHDA